MNYQEADTQLQGRCKERRKVDNNTYLERRGSAIAMKLHDTDIMTFQNGSIVLNSGGWRTVTTKDRLNHGLSGTGFHIHQDKGVWYVQGKSDKVVRFIDNMVINLKTGTIKGGVKVSKEREKADKKLKAKVKAYAQLCADAIPLDKPNGGDCWYCYMRTDKGVSLGETFRDTSHIDNHIKEGYVVPSLVYRALEMRYKAPMAFWQSFKDTGWDNKDREFGRHAVKRAVYRHIMNLKGYSV